MSGHAEIPDKSIRIAIDRGGTFTDCHASYPSPTVDDPNHVSETILKLLSVDPAYADAPREGVRRLLERILKVSVPASEPIPTTKIDSIRLSTTVATNALLERKGSRHALMITKGFKDLLLIGNQSRPKIFDLSISKPSVLYSRVVEVDERVTLLGYSSDPKANERQVQFDEEGRPTRGYDGESLESSRKIVRGVSGEAIEIIKTPDESILRHELTTLYEEGFESIAVVLMHSYTYPQHEQLIGQWAKNIGFTQISLSSELMPMIKIVTRGTSSTADAYLTPVLKQYIEGFFSGFDASLRDSVSEPSTANPQQRRTVVEFMRSDGGLSSLSNFSGLHSILSGPAGGAVGCALTCWDGIEKSPIIGVDVGGTSSDLSRFDGRSEVVWETTTAGVTIQSPQLDINTVAAGGGSRLFWRNGLFVTGPESAGALPGPTCYRRNGPLAVTDANLFLGRLVPSHFPHIFGEHENEPLDVESSAQAFKNLAHDINQDLRQRHVSGQREREMSVDEVAWGFLKIANETMCRPIRALTSSRGYATSKHILSAFGGAGGQHACSIASTLGINRILIHRYSSVLSAYGMALADRVVERQWPCAQTWSLSNQRDENSNVLNQLKQLTLQVFKVLSDQGFKEERIKVEPYLNLRYDGTDTSLMILNESSTDTFDYAEAFEKKYKQEFGFVLENKDLIIDDIRVRGIGKSFDSLGKSVWQEVKETTFKVIHDDINRQITSQNVYFDGRGRLETPIYELQSLQVGDIVKGPALIIDDTQTLVIDPEARAKILSKHVYIELGDRMTE